MCMNVEPSAGVGTAYHIPEKSRPPPSSRQLCGISLAVGREGLMISAHAAVLAGLISGRSGAMNHSCQEFLLQSVSR